MKKCIKLNIPDSIVTIFYILILCGIATYLLPSGAYERQIDPERGITIIVPDSYHVTSHTPVNLFDIFQAIPKGMIDASHIILFVLLAGGSFGIIYSTGMIGAWIGSISRRYEGKEQRLIPIIMILFSIPCALLGFAEELLPIIPIFVSFAIRLGFDKMTSIGMVLLGIFSGFVSGVLNPFSTGVAQNIVDLPLYSGFAYRLVCYFVLLTASIVFILHKAKTKRFSTEFEEEDESSGCFFIEEIPELTKKHKLITLVFFIGFIAMIACVVFLHFDFIEIATIFMMTGIAVGLASGYRSNRIVSEFINGAANVLYAALIIGVARSIFVIMTQGNILDTVIYQLSHIISSISTTISSISMMAFHSIITLFIPSSSGQAAVTMPIMASIADLLGVTRQTTVLAFQLGEGMTMLLNPTSGFLMAALALCGISWKRWVKWIAPLFIAWAILDCILVAAADIIEYGPF